MLKHRIARLEKTPQGSPGGALRPEGPLRLDRRKLRAITPGHHRPGCRPNWQRNRGSLAHLDRGGIRDRQLVLAGKGITILACLL